MTAGFSNNLPTQPINVRLMASDWCEGIAPKSTATASGVLAWTTFTALRLLSFPASAYRAEVAAPRDHGLLTHIPFQPALSACLIPCAGHKHRHEYGLAIVSGRRLCCRVCRVLSHVQLRAIFAVAPFPGVKMCAAFLAYSVRFAHVSTSYPAAAASSLSQSCCSSRRRYFLRTRYFLACL